MEEPSRIKHSSVRTFKEKIYYVLVVLVSIGVWAWLFYSIYSEANGVYNDFIKTPELKVAETESTLTEKDIPLPVAEFSDYCFVRNSFEGYDNLIRLNPSQLLEGETCLSYEEVKDEECFTYTSDNRGIQKVDIASLGIGYSCLPPNYYKPEQAEIARANYETLNKPLETTAVKESEFPVFSDVQTKVSKIAESLTTPVLILLFFVFGLYSHLLAMAYIRQNGVKVGPQQFSEIYEAVKHLSGRLGMHKQPDVFVITGHGLLNAFATRLVFRRIIVVYSDLAEALIEGRDQKQLLAVLSHELGHQALGHTRLIEWFFWPGKTVPFLGSGLSRAREYSCDRVMKSLIADNQVCEKALIKLAAGGFLGSKTDIEVYLNQRKEEGGFFAWLSEKLSTHPHLPNRIIAVRKYGALEHPGKNGGQEQNLG